jgi:hypothetical protein
MVLGQKLWEGRGKSVGTGLIKSVGMESIKSEYSWMAQVKGLGCAEGLDGTINVTAVSVTTPKGAGRANDQGIFMMANGEMCVLKGFDLLKMNAGGNPSAVGLYMFMTQSEKLNWMNDLIGLATFEALDPMWMEVAITIYEWK